MWINTGLMKEKGYTLNEVMCMQLLKQNRTEDQEEFIATYMDDNILERFAEEDIITVVNKKKKADSEFSVMRLSKKGEKILENIETPQIETGDIQMFDYLSEMYLQNEDDERVIGNKKKTKQYCAIFRKRLGLTLHEMYWLCWLFLEDYKFTKRLEYIFFDSNKYRYSTFESQFESSPLYQFLDDNKKKVEDLWHKKIKENG